MSPAAKSRRLLRSSTHSTDRGLILLLTILVCMAFIPTIGAHLFSLSIAILCDMAICLASVTLRHRQIIGDSARRKVDIDSPLGDQFRPNPWRAFNEPIAYFALRFRSCSAFHLFSDLLLRESTVLQILLVETV